MIRFLETGQYQSLIFGLHYGIYSSNTYRHLGVFLRMSLELKDFFKGYHMG